MPEMMDDYQFAMSEEEQAEIDEMNALAEQDEMEYYMREEAERDEREREWAEEAHKAMHTKEEE